VAASDRRSFGSGEPFGTSWAISIRGSNPAVWIQAAREGSMTPPDNRPRADRRDLLRQLTHVDPDRNPTRHALLLQQLERFALLTQVPAPSPAPSGRAS
jgi:hypothetical protein